MIIYHITKSKAGEGLPAVYDENSCDKKVVNFLKHYFKNQKEKKFPFEDIAKLGIKVKIEKNKFYILKNNNILLENTLLKLDENSFELITQIHPSALEVIYLLPLFADFEKCLAFALIENL